MKVKVDGRIAMEGGTGAQGPTIFRTIIFLLPPCNLKTDNLNNSFIFTVNLTLLKEILGIPRWSGGGGGVGQGEGGRKR